ncbi:G-protein coupled receptor Mth-like [Artemia franciscana]|uniref:G-protein coupled receptor Mth-like n=1 Tax=Artemia franciscana TaxID=6661 RepID=UPI0032D9F8B7
MIHKCSEHWRDKEVTNLCQNENYRDPFINTPITQIYTNITYKNIYCALCNNEIDVMKLYFWKPKLKCKGVEKELKKELLRNFLKWNESISKWYLNIQDGEGKKYCECEVTYIPENIDSFVRPCDNYIISKCSAKNQDSSLCEAYYAPVILEEQEYKNVHCALCNNLTYSNSTSENLNFECGGYPQINERNAFNSFAMLFDFKEDKDEECGNKSVFDPFLKKCRTLYCPKGTILQNEVCVGISNVASNQGKSIARAPDKQSNISILSFQNNTMILKSEKKPVSTTCPKLKLEKEEYLEFLNRTIFVKTYNRFYEVGQYEIENASILICAKSLPDNDESEFLKGFTIFCLLLSEVCLLIHIAFSFKTSDFRNLSGWCLLSLSFSLLIAFGMFILLPIIPKDTVQCSSIAALMHYFFLSAFFWSSVIAFDLLKTLRLATTRLRSPHKKSHRFIYYSLWSWSSPAIIVCIAMLIDNIGDCSVMLCPEYGTDICWIKNKTALVVYFAIPLAIILTANFVLFFWSLYVIRSNSIRRPQSRKEAYLFFRLAVLMGLSWTSGLVAGLADIPFMWYFFVALCASQGVFILLAFTFNAKTAKSWWRKTWGHSKESQPVSSSWTTSNGTFHPTSYSVNIAK